VTKPACHDVIPLQRGHTTSTIQALHRCAGLFAPAKSRRVLRRTRTTSNIRIRLDILLFQIYENGQAVHV